MNYNLDNPEICKEDKKIIVHTILIPLINKMQAGNKKIIKAIDKLNIDFSKKKKIYKSFKLDISKLEIRINKSDKNNLIKIIWILFLKIKYLGQSDYQF